MFLSEIINVIVLYLMLAQFYAFAFSALRNFFVCNTTG